MNPSNLQRKYPAGILITILRTLHLVYAWQREREREREIQTTQNLVSKLRSLSLIQSRPFRTQAQAKVGVETVWSKSSQTASSTPGHVVLSEALLEMMVKFAFKRIESHGPIVQWLALSAHNWEVRGSIPRLDGENLGVSFHV